MTQIPSKDEILAWISDNPTLTSKRDIAKAFGIKGADRIELKRILRELEAEGHLAKRKKTYRNPDKLPPVAVLEVAEITPDGDVYARALEWQGEGEPPRVLFIAK
ncbi:MAG: ribonuclease R, partial [Maritimibacter sp.]|nr:ribonuclease R [Maritimibacter sp.]